MTAAPPLDTDQSKARFLTPTFVHRHAGIRVTRENATEVLAFIEEHGRDSEVNFGRTYVQVFGPDNWPHVMYGDYLVVDLVTKIPTTMNVGQFTTDFALEWDGKVGRTA